MHAGLRRRGARARLARPRPALVPLIEQRPRGGRHRARRPRRHRLHRRARASPARCWSARASRTRSATRCASRRSASIISRAICSRRCSPTRGPEFPFVALLVSGGHSQLFDVDRRRPLPPARRHAGRRGRRGVRQDGEAPGPALSRRPRAREARRAGRARRGVAAAADARLGQSRHELLGLEDRGADARARSCGGDGALDGAARRPTSRASSRRRSSTCSSRRRSRRSTRPVANGWSSPAAWARTASCARGSCARSSKRGGRVYFPDLEFCTDNGAMIALAGALRLASQQERRRRVRGAAAVGAFGAGGALNRVASCNARRPCVPDLQPRRDELAALTTARSCAPAP